MKLIGLSGRSHGFFERWQALPLAGLLLAAGGIAVHAQTSASKPQAVVIKVVAADSAGNPVPNLTASDVSVFDNGSPQQIVSMRLNQSEGARPLVVLFDLMNAGESSRGAVWNAVKTSMAHLQSTGPVYLYLLVEDGSLYPVHALPGAAVAPEAANADWLKDIGPLMDAAMQKVSQAKPLEIRAASPNSLQARFSATYHALDDMRR
jgi:hypothetical protein